MQLVEPQEQFQLKSIKLRHLCTKNWVLSLVIENCNIPIEMKLCDYIPLLLQWMLFIIYSEMIAIDLKFISFEQLEIQFSLLTNQVVIVFVEQSYSVHEDHSETVCDLYAWWEIYSGVKGI